MARKAAAASKAGNTIMLVEDDRVVARLLSHMLTQRGFDVEVSEDGRKAIESLNKKDKTPLLVLLDIILPCADGFEVLNRLRAQKGWKKVPVIMLTSKTQETNVVRAFESGADDYVTKPFQIGELIVRMNRLLN